MEKTHRRVQQEELGHRGRKHDPPYRIRNTLPCQSRAAQRPSTRAERGRSAGRDPNFEVTLAWRCCQQLRSAAHTKASPKGRAIAAKVIDGFHTCPIPEIAPIGPHPACRKDQFLAYFSTARASNGGTEAVNGVIEINRRIARGFPNLHNSLLRMILAAGRLTHANLR